MARSFSTLITNPRELLLLRLARKLGGARLTLWLARRLYRLGVEGEDHLPPAGACIVVFNHVANMADTLVYTLVHSRRPDVYLFHWRLIQPGLESLFAAFGLPADRLLPVYQRQVFSAGEVLRARQALLAGAAVAMAPEGEPTWDGRLQHPLAPGAAWLALHTAAPVVPVVSHGGYDVQPVWWVEKRRLTGRIRIRFGQPFQLCPDPVESISRAALDEGSQRIWEAMAALLPD